MSNPPASYSRERNPARNIQQMAWETLGPRIEAAEKAQDLPTLRALEEEIRQAIAGLVEDGIYRVEDAIIRIANETGQEKTWEENEFDGQYEDIAFARALEHDYVFDLGERVWNAIHNWLQVHQAPEAMWKLINDYANLHHAGNALFLGLELDRMNAYCLAASFRSATVQMHALRQVNR